MPGTTDKQVLFTPQRASEYASYGAQAPLIIVEAPAGAEALIGRALKDVTITITGAYVFLLMIAGLTAVKVAILAQLDGMTLSSAGPDEIAGHYDPETTDPSDAEVVTSGTGDGAITHDTLQTAELAPTGARYALYTLTVGGTPGDITFDIAELRGL